MIIGSASSENMANVKDRIPKSVLDCWLTAFKSCTDELHSVTVYVDKLRWFEIARESSLDMKAANDCAKKGISRVQVFNKDKWEEDAGDIVTFIITDDGRDDFIIVATE